MKRLSFTRNFSLLRYSGGGLGWGRFIFAAACMLLLSIHAATAAELAIDHADSPGAVKLVLANNVADIYVDAKDAKLETIAAGLLADDIERVTGKKPRVVNDPAQLGADAIIIGSVGHSALVDQLIAANKVNAADVSGQWETYKLQVVSQPLPNVQNALVIVGSDRRGAAYGVFDLSKSIGVSPWYWFADVTPTHQDSLVVKPTTAKDGPPSVKYRGIFINDEDWGLEPWAAKTFEPRQGNIGPKTYAKVFELILRLRGNYLWPAMHPVSMEFGRIPANITLADDWGIVMGASHTEAMNRNNVAWPKEGTGPWRYDTNRENVRAYWEQWAKLRGPFEAVWTLGIRGVHDSAMQGPVNANGRPDVPADIKIVENAISDQRDLLKEYVNSDLSKVPQLFCPYKEVLPLYQAGMKVPDDVTLLWTEDNFGYIRQLSTPAEQQRPGHAGVYYHISYLGRPRSYVWLNTTPPSLIWEEMTKAYAYGADRVWVLNVGDIKPGEVGMDFWMRLGWNINAYDRMSITHFLSDYFRDQFGEDQAEPIAQVMAGYYRLGFARKPEAMDYEGINAAEAAERLADYDSLLQRAQEISARLPAEKRDAFFELVLYPLEMCAESSHVYLDPAQSQAAVKKIKDETAYYNDTLVGGKWKNYMTAQGTTSTTWGYKWPQGNPPAPAAATTQPAAILSVEAIHYDRNLPRNGAQWQSIADLGRQHDCMAIFPVTAPSVTADQVTANSPEMDYDFDTAAGAPLQVTVYAIPTHRINAERGLQYAAAIDDEKPQLVSFEQAAGDTNRTWSWNVIHNTAITHTTHSGIAPGKHTLKIFMVDPGVLLEKFVVSDGALPASEFGPPETHRP